MGDPGKPTSAAVTPVTPANSQWPIMVAVCVVIVAVMGGVITVTIHGDNQSTPIVVSLLGFATAIVGTLLALVKVNQVGGQVQDLRISVDGRMERLLASTEAAASAQGQLAGQDRERAVQAEAVIAAVTAAKQHTDETELAAFRAAAVTVPSVPVEVVVANPAPVPVEIAEHPTPAEAAADATMNDQRRRAALADAVNMAD